MFCGSYFVLSVHAYSGHLVGHGRILGHGGFFGLKVLICQTWEYIQALTLFWYGRYYGRRRYQKSTFLLYTCTELDGWASIQRCFDVENLDKECYTFSISPDYSGVVSRCIGLFLLVRVFVYKSVIVFVCVLVFVVLLVVC